MSDQTRDKLESLAREIYGLIWVHREDEAGRRLRDLGSDAIPVAHALVNGNYRWPPLIKKLGDALIGTFVCSFVVAPIVYSLFWNVPDIYKGQKWLFYFGLSGGCVIGELFVGSFLEMFFSSRRFVKIRDEADQRKLDIAGELLADALPGNQELIFAILDALRSRKCVYVAPSNPIDVRLEKALTASLGTCAPEVLFGLSDQQRYTVGSKLGTILDRMSDEEVNSTGDSDEAALGISLIKTSLHIPSRDRVERVRSIAAQNLEAAGYRWAPMAQCARELLPDIEEALRCSEGKDVLLRGSLADASAEVELVRAAIQPGETRAEELLRVAE